MSRNNVAMNDVGRTGKARALVTGGASGIGLSIVQEFLKREWDVVSLDKQPSPLPHHTAGYTSFIADISKEEEIQAVFETFDAGSAIDAVVNCAATIESEAQAGLDNLDRISLETILAVNLVGVVLICRASLPFLGRSRRPSIVNIGSISGTEKASPFLAYAASKGGVLSLTKSLAKHLGSLGIRVNMVSPGSVPDTGFWALQHGRNASFAEKAAMMSVAPLKKTASPSSVAAVVWFLASEASRSITGVNLVVDSGAVL
jgi:NAD(P)-dependent dehydrogenase (short-subunit alcohol dehydrogenase family)